MQQKGNLPREVIHFFLFLIFLLTGASLFSYSPNDPTILSYSLKGSTNWIGPVGANLAATFFEIFGFGAWWIPVLFLVLTLVAIPKLKSFIRPIPLFLLGWLAMLLSTCIFFSLFLKDLFPETHFFYLLGEYHGGLLGVFISETLTQWMGKAGTVLVAFFIFFIGLWTATPFSLTALFFILNSFRSSKKDSVPTQKPKQERPSQDSFFKQVVEQAPRIVEPFKKKQEIADEREKVSDFHVSRLKGNFSLPPLDLLQDPVLDHSETEKDLYYKNAQILEQKLLDFGVKGKVVEICPGPVVTMYEFAPAPGIKINKVTSLVDDLALALKSRSVRIVAPIPGKAVIGIELANPSRQTVYLKEILSSDIFIMHKGLLPLALGKDIVGAPEVTDLSRMPHLLIAGATGTGKSVGLNAMICSLLYRHGPDTLRLLLIDPKRIELSLYDGIPHLLHPVVSEPKEATRALKWAVLEMERRYQVLEEAQARNLESFNKTTENPLPYLVVIIDELSDLMMVSSREVEASITRLAQMARAAGIHLLVATQRPSVDVITGLIKANFPARISFKVSSKVDSRTILDVMGAERLLGMGDMLFIPPGASHLQRIHGAYISEKEIAKIAAYLKSQAKPEYDMTVVEPVPGEESLDAQSRTESVDEMYGDAIKIVRETGNASISMLQRRLRVGYNRAARMIEQMETEGIVSPMDNTGRRQVLQGME